MYTSDVESQLLYDPTANISFEPFSVRQGFIKKLYGILSVQLLVTVLIASPFVLMDEYKVQKFIFENMWLFYLSMITSLTVVVLFACVPSMMTQVPLNYILLALFTVSEGISVGMISSLYTTMSVVSTLGLVAAVVVVLSAFAANTKIDLTRSLWPYLLAVTVVMMGAGLVLIFFPSHIGMMIYSTVGAILFSVYIVFDTQMILGGKSSMQFGIDDYVPAAIALYVDIISLFIYLLQLFGEQRRGD
jgi:FtsH-binding integral membrane protein